jgi:hypothetical protein
MAISALSHSCGKRKVGSLTRGISQVGKKTWGAERGHTAKVSPEGGAPSGLAFNFYSRERLNFVINDDQKGTAII